MKKTVLSIIFATLLCKSVFTQISPVHNFAFDGDAKDQKSSITGTVTEAQLVEDRNSIANQAYSFDGINDKISFGNVLNMDASDFSISVWAKVSSFKGEKNGTSSAGAFILAKGASIFNTPSRAGYAIRARKENNKNIFEFLVGNQNNAIAVAKGGDFAKNTWYHLIAIKSSDKIQLYANCELVGESPITPQSNVNNNSKFQLGVSDRLGNDPDGDIFFEGVIDDLSFYNRALNSCDLKYFCPRCNFHTKHTFSDLIDDSNNNINGTGYESSKTNGRNINDDAYYFNGWSSKINFGNTLDMSTNDFTITMWTKVAKFEGQKSGTGSAGTFLLAKGVSLFTSPSRAGYGIRSRLENDKNIFEFLVGNQNNQIIVAKGGDFEPNVWYHIVAVRSSDKIYLYVNGELIGENTIDAASNLNNNSTFQLGLADRLGNDPNGDIYFHGSIDELTIYDCGRNSEEVICEYENTKPNNIGTFVLSNTKHSSAFALFPNPVNDILTLENKSGKDTQIKVFNTTGNLIMTSTQTTLNFTELNKGVYFVQVSTSDSTDSFKVIKE